MIKRHISIKYQNKYYFFNSKFNENKIIFSLSLTQILNTYNLYVFGLHLKKLNSDMEATDLTGIQFVGLILPNLQ